MYYPKSQIKTGKYTQGNELQLSSTKEMYVGPYWSTSKGEHFTGKSPDDKPNFKLEITNQTPEANPGAVLVEYLPPDYYVEDTSYYIAKNKKTRKAAPRDPMPTPPLPSKKDFKRYFASKTNEIKFIEISKTEYSKFKEKSSEVNWTLYTPIEIDWKVEGTREEVYLKNKETVSKTQIPGFDLYFREKYDKFWSSK